MTDTHADADRPWSPYIVAPKPCPHCGRVPSVVLVLAGSSAPDKPKEFYIRCPRCRLVTLAMRDEEELISVWDATVDAIMERRAATAIEDTSDDTMTEGVPESNGKPTIDGHSIYRLHAIGIP